MMDDRTGIFEEVKEFPDPGAARRFASLVGLDSMKCRLLKEARLLLDPESVTDWSQKHHHRKIKIADFFRDRPPLFIFAGDVGTGKTALAETFGDAIAREAEIAVTARSSNPTSGATVPAAWPTATSGASSSTSSTGSAPCRVMNLFHPWWEQWPDRLRIETEELQTLGVQFTRDEAAFCAGVLRWLFDYPINGVPIKLEATFPDLYPFFRFEIRAPDLSLPYHQHPLSRNLCLLGRPTDNWDQDLTVARLLKEQLPNVLFAGQTSDAAAVAEIEQHQAEPYTDYYPYDHLRPSMILVDGSWYIDPAETSGVLKIGLAPQSERDPPSFLRAAVLEVRANNNLLLARANDEIRNAFQASIFTSRWIQLSEPLRDMNSATFFQEAKRLDPGAKFSAQHPFKDGCLELWGVVFPEESAWRKPTGQGWVFVSRFQKQVDFIPPGAKVTVLNSKARRLKKVKPPWRK